MTRAPSSPSSNVGPRKNGWSRPRRLFREPLVHFALLGTALFAIYAFVGGGSSNDGPGPRIVVTRAEIDRLAQGFHARWRRPPSEGELAGLVADQVKEEMFYREAIALGLDRDDTIVRRRLAQKVEFLIQDAAVVPEPGPADLSAFLARHPERFRVASRFTFVHAYFSEARHNSQAERIARAALQAAPAGVDPIGDASLVDAVQRDRGAGEVRAMLGAEFVHALETLPTGAWQGPVRSSYGWHLVRLEQRVSGQVPSLSEIEARVRKDWLDAQRAAANAQALERLRARYQVRVEDAVAAKAVAQHLSGAK